MQTIPARPRFGFSYFSDPNSSIFERQYVSIRRDSHYLYHPINCSSFGFGFSHRSSSYPNKFRRSEHTTHFQPLRVKNFNVVKCSESDLSCESSSSVENELLLLFYKVEISSRIQRALNKDQFDLAKLLEEKLAQVEGAMQRQMEDRRGQTSKRDRNELGFSLLQLKSDLQNAVENERYAEAAILRDKVAQKESEMLAMSLEGLSTVEADFKFRLGQKVYHKQFGYLAVVCGMDPVCCESEQWASVAGVDKLERRGSQPFYKVLVDSDSSDILVTYVAEDRLDLPSESQNQELKASNFNHPYVYLLFYGADGKGDLIPTKVLRDMYGASRHEVPMDEDNEDGESSQQ